jgi:hypothetical protein
MKRAANKTIWTEFKAIEFYFESNNVIIYSYQHSMKKYLPRVFLNFTNLNQQVVVF